MVYQARTVGSLAIGSDIEFGVLNVDIAEAEVACRFNFDNESPFTRISEAQGSCSVPNNTSVGIYVVEVLVHGKTLSYKNVRIVSQLSNVTVHQVQPSVFGIDYPPFTGFTGTNFPLVGLTCEFGDGVESNIVWRSSSEVLCLCACY